MRSSADSIPSSGGVFRLALPIILANLSLPLVGAVDTAVVGHLGSEHYLAGLGIVTTVFASLYWVLGFIRMGTTGFAAQSLGAGDQVALGASFGRGLLMAIALAVVLIALQNPIGQVAFSLLEGSTDALDAAESYFFIRIWSAPGALINFVVMGWLIGVQRTRDALLIQLVLNGLNAGLDVLFVEGFGWGIDGVAAGTAIAEYVAAGLGVSIVLRRMRQMGAILQWDGLLERAGLARLFSVNSDIFIRTFFLVLAFAIVTREGGKLGDLVLAANAILLNLQAFVSFGLDGFAQAAEALVGKAYGGKDRKALRATVRLSSFWALGTAATYALIFALLGPTLIGIYTGLDEVRETTLTYLPWLIASPILSVWCFQLDGIFIGAQRTRDMRNMMVIAFAAFLATLYGFVADGGNHALWGALMVFFVARGLTLAARYPALERSVSDSVSTGASATNN